MEHQQFEGFTKEFGPPSDMGGYCGALQVKNVNIVNTDPTNGKETDFGNFLVSKWKPSEEEIMQLFHGGFVYLWIRGPGHPVVMLGTQAPEVEHEST